MKIMKLVIGNSNNPYMTKVCTLMPVLNPQNKVNGFPPDVYFALWYLKIAEPQLKSEMIKANMAAIG